MRLTFIIWFAIFFLNSCKNGENNKNPSQAIQDSTSNTETKKASNMNSNGIVENNNSESINSKDEWYWKNTLMSNDNKFDAWDEGAASLIMTYKNQQNNAQSRNIEVGKIDSDGLVTLTLPSEIKTETKLNNLSNLVFYDIQDISTLVYVNGNTGYFSNTTLKVEKNGIVIGNMTMGNSVRTTYNLVNQSTLTMGDEGFLIYLVYVDSDSGIMGDEIRADKVRRDGTNTLEAETTVVYDLNFKSGWNFVKVEVIGKYDLKHERGLNASWFKKHKHTVVPEITNQTNYFYRKLGI